MKRHVSFLAGFCAAAFAAMLICPVASAQDTARVNIPFAFTANQRVLQAGCYKVHRQGETIMMLVNCTSGNVVGLMVHTTNADHGIGQSSLVFHAGAGNYRLVQVRFAYSNRQTDLAPPTKREIEREQAANLEGRTVEISMR
jgi:hypothetical protein